MRRMMPVIEWEITDPQGVNCADHNRQIEMPFKIMAPPLYPTITLRRLDSYLIVSTSSRRIHWWFIMMWAQRIDLLLEQIASKYTGRLITKALISVFSWSTSVICVPVYTSLLLYSFNFLSLSVSLSNSFRWCVSAVTGNYSGGQEPQWCWDVSPLIHLQRDASVCVWKTTCVCVCVPLASFLKASPDNLLFNWLAAF